MKLDILAFAAHPDDTELACSGTLFSHKQKGKKVGVVDLTMGQLGSRGTAELRLEEADKAKEILGLDIRENLGMEDGLFENNWENKLHIIRMIRKYRPTIVLANAIEDRHPDHGKASKLVSEACFYAGLLKIETELDGDIQEHYRPKALYYYIQDRYHKPDFVVDISNYMEIKMDAIKAFSSQFNAAINDGPQTPISSPNFLSFVEGRAAEFGRQINTKYGEGFMTDRTLGIKDLTILD